MSTVKADSPKESFWSTKWSSKNLSKEEKNVFEDVIAYLFDGVMLSHQPSFQYLKEHCAKLPREITKERAPEYYISLLRYLLVEPVICCKETDESTLIYKIGQLHGFVHYLVHGIKVINVELVNKALESVCQDDEAYPQLFISGPGGNDERDRKRILEMFYNFQTFALGLYRKNLATTVQPALRVIEAYFGNTSTYSNEAFFVITEWFMHADAAIYLSTPDKKNWAAWHKELCVRTAEFAKKGPWRLEISGRNAYVSMEKWDPELSAIGDAFRKDAGN